MNIQNYYCLGKIIKKYGINNEVIIKLDTDDPKFYLNLKSIFIQFKKKLIFFLLSSSRLNKKNNLIISFHDINNYDIINIIIGKLVFLPLNTLPKLKENKFYYHEIIGFSIINQFNKKIGNIILISYQNHYNYFILENNYKKNIYIPIIDSWIISVCKKNKIINMTLPEGIESIY